MVVKASCRLHRKPPREYTNRTTGAASLSMTLIPISLTFNCWRLPMMTCCLFFYIKFNHILFMACNQWFCNLPGLRAACRSHAGRTRHLQSAHYSFSDSANINCLMVFASTFNSADQLLYYN
jgi:hypothetical protein